MSDATERLIKNARNALPGSLDSVILLELFNVLDTFFRESSIWTEDIPFPVLAADIAGTIYYIEPESNAIIVRLFNVANEDLFRQRAFMSLPGEVTFATPPSNDGIMTATVALSVVDPVLLDGYPEFPEWVLQKHGVGILDGLLGRMMLQPSKPYTNAQLGVAHMSAFRRTISVASTEADHRNVHKAQAWMYPRQFSTRRW